jgi:hypothetical protein
MSVPAGRSDLGLEPGTATAAIDVVTDTVVVVVVVGALGEDVVLDAVTPLRDPPLQAPTRPAAARPAPSRNRRRVRPVATPGGGVRWGSAITTP